MASRFHRILRLFLGICSIAWAACRACVGRPLASTRTAARRSLPVTRRRIPTPSGTSIANWRPLIGSSSSSGAPYWALRHDAGPHFLLYLHDPNTGLTLLHAFDTPYARSAFEYSLSRGEPSRWPDYLVSS